MCVFTVGGGGVGGGGGGGGGGRGDDVIIDTNVQISTAFVIESLLLELH